MEEAVTLTNKNGKKLFGIVHIPDAKKALPKRVGVNLLNPGIKYRVAPHRLNVKIARRLCNEGYYVLRFDPEGIGDSEGELPDNLLTADVWEQIQKGRFIADVNTANQFFIDTCAIEHLLLIGNCGGAITALLASEKDARVKGLVLIDVPVNLRTAQQTFADKVAPGSEKADWLFLEYIKRLTRPQSWARFLTLQTDYRALIRTLFLKSKKTLLPSVQLSKNHDFQQRCTKYNLNHLFFQAVESFIGEEKPLLFILAGNDKGVPLFQQHFQSVYFNENRPYRNVTVKKIDQANHIYTLNEWQEKLLTGIVNWISGTNHGSTN